MSSDGARPRRRRRERGCRRRDSDDHRLSECHRAHGRRDGGHDGGVGRGTPRSTTWSRASSVAWRSKRSSCWRSPAAPAARGGAERRAVLVCGAMRTCVLTVSTSVSRRASEDESGPLLAQLAEEAGADVEAMEVVPDDFSLIEDRLASLRRRRLRPDLHHRRHRLHTRRHHAGGGAGGDRARRARHRRGAARRVG